MSYARFSKTSDVYLYADVSGGLTCCSCWLSSTGRGEFVRLMTPEDATAHLRLHEAAGHHCGFEFDEPLTDGNRGHWHYRSWDDLIAEVTSPTEGAFTYD